MKQRIDEVYVMIIAATSNRPGRYSHCCKTWAKNFSNVLISGDCEIEKNIPHIVATKNKGWTSCPTKLFKGMEAIYKDSKECQWAFLADDDTFVNWVNLKKLIDRLNENEMVMYGRDMTTAFKFNGRAVPFLSGGGGTLISIKALKKIIKKAKQLDWMRWLSRESAACLKWKFEGDIPDDTGADVKLGYAAQVFDIQQKHCPGLFHEGPIGYHKKTEMDILNSITFHRITPAQTKKLEEIIIQNEKDCTIEKGFRRIK